MREIPDNVVDVNGRIRTKKLIEFLNGVKPSNRLKDVASPLEQITKQYSDQEILKRSIMAFKSSASQIKSYSPECYYVFELMMNSGCRVSEILSIKCSDIMVNGMVRVKGKKRGQDRIINSGNAMEYVMKCRERGVSPFQNVNRKFVWSVFKRFGIYLEVDSSGKKAVTHAIRHLVIASAKNSQVDIDTTGSFIGHKNKSNTERYGKIKKK